MTLFPRTRVGTQWPAARLVSVRWTYLVLFIVWIILVIVAVILLIVYAEDVGMKGLAWVPIIAGVFAIFLGVVLLFCCREGANRLSWRKRILLFGIFDKIDDEELKNTEFGIRAGKEGAWIELGNRASLGNFKSLQINLDQLPTL